MKQYTYEKPTCDSGVGPHGGGGGGGDGSGIVVLVMVTVVGVMIQPIHQASNQDDEESAAASQPTTHHNSRYAQSEQKLTSSACMCKCACVHYAYTFTSRCAVYFSIVLSTEVDTRTLDRQVGR